MPASRIAAATAAATIVTTPADLTAGTSEGQRLLTEVKHGQVGLTWRVARQKFALPDKDPEEAAAKAIEEAAAAKAAEESAAVKAAEEVAAGKAVEEAAAAAKAVKEAAAAAKEVGEAALAAAAKAA